MVAVAGAVGVFVDVGRALRRSSGYADKTKTKKTGCVVEAVDVGVRDIRVVVVLC